MSLLKFVLPCFTLFLLLSTTSCDNSTYEQNLLGTYRILEIAPIDTTSRISAKIRDAVNWTISLKDSNNFEFNGIGEPVFGYWTSEDKKGKDITMSFSTAGHTIDAKFGGSTIYFDKPDKLFDSIFRRATFVRSE
ncbi:MAG: hypothetical protein JNN00_01030 [Chitinophagaceae bacterium]|nr:hypothetical protein [Chitinophagaceae bacterium]